MSELLTLSVDLGKYRERRGAIAFTIVIGWEGDRGEDNSQIQEVTTSSRPGRGGKKKRGTKKGT